MYLLVLNSIITMYTSDCIVLIIFTICLMIQFIQSTPGSSGNNDHEVDNGDFYCVEGGTDC